MSDELFEFAMNRSSALALSHDSGEGLMPQAIVLRYAVSAKSTHSNLMLQCMTAKAKGF
jgi:hypothetical protein